MERGCPREPRLDEPLGLLIFSGARTAGVRLTSAAAVAAPTTRKQRREDDAGRKDREQNPDAPKCLSHLIALRAASGFGCRESSPPPFVCGVRKFGRTSQNIRFAGKTEFTHPHAGSIPVHETQHTKESHIRWTGRLRLIACAGVVPRDLLSFCNPFCNREETAAAWRSYRTVSVFAREGGDDREGGDHGTDRNSGT